MEARLIRAALIAAALFVLTGANYRTPNFTVETADPQLAEQFAKAAEKYRHDLALDWIGQELPNWSQACPITVQVGPRLGAGGATTFLFNNGEVYGWRMTIQGSAERVLDSVLPHEITHMVYASYFRRPLPRWADEGGASSVEHASEKAKHRTMLEQFLRTNRGIAFNQMFAMTEYPADVMPLYAQAYSLADYLIQQGGRRRYVDYLAEGLRTNQWGAATERFYGLKDLGVLQNSWVAWVGKGSPQLAPRKAPEEAAPEAVAADRRRPRPEPNLIYHMPLGASGSTTTVASPAKMALGQGIPAAPAPEPPVQAGPIRAEVTHPQAIQGPGQ